MVILAQILGTALLAGYFIIAGVMNLRGWTVIVARMRDKRIPAAPLVLALAILLQISCSLALFATATVTVGAIGLIVFTVLANLLFHAYWRFPDPKARFDHLNLFLANIAVIGGLLLLVNRGAPG